MSKTPKSIEKEIQLLFNWAIIFVTMGIGILFSWIATGGAIPTWATIIHALGSAITITGFFFCLFIGWRLRAVTDFGRSHPSPDNKIFSIENLRIRGKPWPEDATVVLVTGYFDLLHPGHTEFLRACKKDNKEVLVVGVHSDILAQKIKGVDRPYLNAEDRIQIMSNLDQVDYVFEASSFYDTAPYNILQLINPDFVVFSRENKPYPRKSEIEEFVELMNRPSGGKFQTRIIHFSRPDLSTTMLSKMVFERMITVSDERTKELLSSIPDIHIRQQISDDISRESDYPEKDKDFWIRETLLTELENLLHLGIKEYQTAAVITFEGYIIGRGFNSRPYIDESQKSNVIHINEDTEEFRNGMPRPVHAEINAILSVLKTSRSMLDFSKFEIYCTTAPCSACAEIISKLGIKKVYFLKDFYNNFGNLVLKNHGVSYEKFT